MCLLGQKFGRWKNPKIAEQLALAAPFVAPPRAYNVRTAAFIAAVCLSSISCLASDLKLDGKSFEISFIERQGPNFILESPAGIVVGHGDGHRGTGQENRVELTFRSGNQFDFERERNPSAIYQRNPEPSNPARVHHDTGASGTIGAWLPVAGSMAPNINMRVRIDSQKVIAEIHAINFTQSFTLTTDGKSCVAEISYALDPGEMGFKMINLKSKVPVERDVLTAEKVRCRLGTGNIF